jgi:hypothetical protein
MIFSFSVGILKGLINLELQLGIVFLHVNIQQQS